MKSWVLAGALMAAMIAQPAWAADFGGDDEGPPPRSGIYEAPRYGYRAPAPAPRYRDDDDDWRYDRRRHAEPYARTCATSDEVRARLTRTGWRDFHDGQPRGNEVVTLRARRPFGRLFELTLDRCSGDILERRALEPGWFRRHFAQRYGSWHNRDYDDRRWRWPRGY